MSAGLDNWQSELPAMEPDVFRQRLIELAAEYEVLHASAADRKGARSPGPSPGRARPIGRSNSLQHMARATSPEGRRSSPERKEPPPPARGLAAPPPS